MSFNVSWKRSFRFFSAIVAPPVCAVNCLCNTEWPVSFRCPSQCSFADIAPTHHAAIFAVSHSRATARCLPFGTSGLHIGALASAATTLPAKQRTYLGLGAGLGAMAHWSSDVVRNCRAFPVNERPDSE